MCVCVCVSVCVCVCVCADGCESVYLPVGLFLCLSQCVFSSSFFFLSVSVLVWLAGLMAGSVLVSLSAQIFG